MKVATVSLALFLVFCVISDTVSESLHEKLNLGGKSGKL